MFLGYYILKLIWVMKFFAPYELTYLKDLNLGQAQYIHAVASPGNEVRGAQNEFFLTCPGFLLGSETVLICLREFQRISGEIDESVLHVLL